MKERRKDRGRERGEGEQFSGLRHQEQVVTWGKREQSIQRNIQHHIQQNDRIADLQGNLDQDLLNMLGNIQMYSNMLLI